MELPSNTSAARSQTTSLRCVASVHHPRSTGGLEMDGKLMIQSKFNNSNVKVAGKHFVALSISSL